MCVFRYLQLAATSICFFYKATYPGYDTISDCNNLLQNHTSTLPAKDCNFIAQCKHSNCCFKFQFRDPPMLDSFLEADNTEGFIHNSQLGKFSISHCQSERADQVRLVGTKSINVSELKTQICRYVRGRNNVHCFCQTQMLVGGNLLNGYFLTQWFPTSFGL